MVFAPAETVADMRELLLEYGAEEGKEEKLRWLICQDAANLAHHRCEAFHGTTAISAHVEPPWRGQTSDETCLDSMRGEKILFVACACVEWNSARLGLTLHRCFKMMQIHVLAQG